MDDRLLLDIEQRLLEFAGVLIEAHGDRLKFDAPAGVLTPELRAELAEGARAAFAATDKPIVVAPTSRAAATAARSKPLNSMARATGRYGRGSGSPAFAPVPGGCGG